jgi:hypothetical protein
MYKNKIICHLNMIYLGGFWLSINIFLSREKTLYLISKSIEEIILI